MHTLPMTCDKKNGINTQVSVVVDNDDDDDDVVNVVVCRTWLTSWPL